MSEKKLAQVVSEWIADRDAYVETMRELVERDEYTPEYMRQVVEEWDIRMMDNIEGILRDSRAKSYQDQVNAGIVDPIAGVWESIG